MGGKHTHTHTGETRHGFEFLTTKGRQEGQDGIRKIYIWNFTLFFFSSTLVTKYNSAFSHPLARQHGFLTHIQPSLQHWCTKLCKNFQSPLFFLNLSQYKPCSKCYEKMYMFIQGRLRQDTRGGSLSDTHAGRCGPPPPPSLPPPPQETQAHPAPPLLNWTPLPPAA